MVTKVSGFQAADGTMFETLELALAHEAKHKAQFAVGALIAALGLADSVVVKDGGSNIDSIVLEDFSLGNREALIEALSVEAEKPARKPRQPREPKPAPVVDTSTAVDMSAKVDSAVNAVDSAATTAAVVSTIASEAAAVAIDPLDELAASLAADETVV